MLNAEEDEVYIRTLLGLYRTVIENTQRTTGIQDPLKVAILAGIQLCDDLEKARTHTRSGEAAMESRTAESTIRSIIERMDRVLPPHTGEQ